jgi:NADH:ubiquinone reductase (H+-translocating)
VTEDSLGRSATSTKVALLREGLARARWPGANSRGDPGVAPTPQQHCVIVGGGFGGAQAAKGLKGVDAVVTLVDRHNYHLFQPLTYQVATGSLSPGEMAIPLRWMFRRDRHVRVLLGEVTGFDLSARTVEVDPGLGLTSRQISYDTLVVAGGSSYAYFGHDDWRSLAVEVKSLESALDVRSRILGAFEAAEVETDQTVRSTWLTFVVVGGGPTGVEMAGQIAELARDTLPREFRDSDPSMGRVVLVESSERLLSSFPPSLSRRALRSLQELGVTPLVGHTVVDVQPEGVTVKAPDGSLSQLACRTVIWAAGVTASPLARTLADASGAAVDPSGRITVEPDLTLPGHPEVIVLGDMVRVRDPGGATSRALPGLAPVAMQEGRYAARLIAARIAGRQVGPFHYRDKGNLATIGRARAVAEIKGLRLSGFPAWATWLGVHLFYLIGFQNRLLVLLRWSVSFLTHGRGSRLITHTEGAGHPGSRRWQGSTAPEGSGTTTET